MIYRLDSQKLRKLVLNVAYEILEKEPQIDENFKDNINIAEEAAQNVLNDFENNTVNQEEEYELIDAEDIGLVVTRLIKARNKGYKIKLKNKKQKLSTNNTGLVDYTEFSVKMFKEIVQ